jgi:hypothetical protein
VLAIAAPILLSGSPFAAMAKGKPTPPVSTTASGAAQLQVGDVVHIEGQVLEDYAYVLQEGSGAVMHRFMVSRPNIDGEPARMAYLTVCTGPTPAECEAEGYAMFAAEGVGLGSQVSADGEITAISAKLNYTTYYLIAASQVLAN